MICKLFMYTNESGYIYSQSIVIKYHDQNLATGTFLEFQDGWLKHKQFFLISNINVSIIYAYSCSNPCI